jgi:uracil-DNA glycosylase
MVGHSEPARQGRRTGRAFLNVKGVHLNQYCAAADQRVGAR